MSAELAEAIPEERHRLPEGQFSHRTPRAIRLAEHPVRRRVGVGRLVDLAHTLLQEIEVVARDQAYLNDAGRLHTQLQSDGIDLFQEVKRFEIHLIKLALNQTHGHQARAAKLLNINPTTLNSKIKLYAIEY